MKQLDETDWQYLQALKETGYYRSNNKYTADNRCSEDVLFLVFGEYCRLKNIQNFSSRNFQDNDHFSDKQYTRGRVYGDINRVLSCGERKNITRYGLAKGFIGHISKKRYFFIGINKNMDVEK